MTTFIELNLESLKSMEEILEIFDDSIYNRHLDYVKTKDILHFNKAVNWMIEDVKDSQIPLKLQYITSLFRYLLHYKKLIFKDAPLIGSNKLLTDLYE
jgi:hypothetical protein